MVARALARLQQGVQERSRRIPWRGGQPSAMLHLRRPGAEVAAKRDALNILGISAFYHDSAACLLRDGEIIAAAQEERFTRKKHDYRFPPKPIEYCLAEAGIGPD